ncbi:MAG: methyltransferase domain-containing protein [Variovorax sp.]|nr:MAG: methyltransferase domain-containing protein [Variovorax sp.]
MSERTLPYFDALYAAADDPYGVRARWYEERKRAVLLAALPQHRFRRAYEPGCGVGELTLALGARCESLLASDTAERAVFLARQRVASLPHVRVELHRLPTQWPRNEGAFDLIVLSELNYFLEEEAMVELARCCNDTLAAGGTLVACDWRPDFEQRCISTDLAHRILSELGLPRLLCHQEEDFLLQVWSRDGRSIAQREGIR